MKGLVTWGLIGCFGGILFQGSNLFIDRHFNKGLKCEVEAISHDKALLQQMVILEKYEACSSTEFQKLVQSVDRMLFLEMQLTNKTIEPTINDRVLMFSYYKDAIEHMQNIYESSKANVAIKSQCEIYRTQAQIYNILKKHWEHSMQLTRHL